MGWGVGCEGEGRGLDVVLIQAASNGFKVDGKAGVRAHGSAQVMVLKPRFVFGACSSWRRRVGSAGGVSQGPSPSSALLVPEPLPESPLPELLPLPAPGSGPFTAEATAGDASVSGLTHGTSRMAVSKQLFLA